MRTGMACLRDVRLGLDEPAAVGTAGFDDFIIVSGTEQWTDTGLTLRPGDRVTINAEGTIQMSPDPNDTASPAGSRRLAPGAPLRQQAAGTLIAQIGDGAPISVGASRTITAQRRPAVARSQRRLSGRQQRGISGRGDHRAPIANAPTATRTMVGLPTIVRKPRSTPAFARRRRATVACPLHLLLQECGNELLHPRPPAAPSPLWQRHRFAEREVLRKDALHPGHEPSVVKAHVVFFIVGKRWVSKFVVPRLPRGHRRPSSCGAASCDCIRRISTPYVSSRPKSRTLL